MRIRRRLAPAAITLAGAALLIASLHLRYGDYEREVFVDIPYGTGTREVARLLSDAGVVRWRWQFLLTRGLRPRVRLQAGEYRFAEAASVWEVFDRLARGDVLFYELAVPEGYNIFDIGAALEAQGIMRAEAFLRAAQDPSLMRDLDPKAPSLEGYLFPDTYRFTRHTTPEQVCKQMTDRFRQVWKTLSGAAEVHDTVTLASLVEKETALAEERPMIASVFLNRLRLEMPLQCDPTTIYAALLEERYRGTIYRSDLESKQRYNTYQHPGLPPGPIANPGLRSLKAALRPAQTDYVYFVALADGSGAHQFSKELAAHQRAVAKYRRGLRQTLQANSASRVPGSQATGGDQRGRMGRAAGPARSNQ